MIKEAFQSRGMEKAAFRNMSGKVGTSQTHSYVSLMYVYFYVLLTIICNANCPLGIIKMIDLLYILVSRLLSRCWTRRCVTR